MAADSEQDKSIIKQLVPLNVLSAEQLELVLGRITISEAKNGDFLFREGDNDGRHIFLLQGQVRLISGTREISITKSGEHNARFALAHQLPRKHSGQAIGNVRFAYINSNVLHDLQIRQAQAQIKPEDDANVDAMTMVLQAKVLQQVPPANIQNVLRRMDEIQAKTGEVVINQGDSADYFYILARGTGIVTRRDPGGERQLAVLSQGDSFGEDALISGNNRTASVSMVSNGTLMRLKKEDFSDLIRRPLVQGIRMDKARPLIQQGAIWLDIRHQEEYAADRLPGALNLPLENLRERCSTFPQDKKYIVYGPAGENAVGTFLLRERGFDVLMLEGWVADQGSGTTSGGGEVSGSSKDPELAPDSALDSTPGKTGQKEQDLEQQLVLYKTKLSQHSAGIRQLHKKLQDTTEEYKNKFAEQDAEIRQLQKKLQVATETNQHLEQALKQASDNKQVAGNTLQLQNRVSELELIIKKLHTEIEDLEEIVQEAAGKESAQNWERERMLLKIEQTEQYLAEQYEINRLLREENEEMTRRMNKT